MTTTKDPFSIDIVLRHPLLNPESISEALSLKAKWSWRVGQRVTNVPAKWTVFYATLQKGDYASEYEGALTKVALFLEKNSTFWTDFIGGDGEADLILNHTINPQDGEGDECFELYLAAAFLRDLSARGVGLRVQGWQGKVFTGATSRRKGNRKQQSKG